MGIRETQIFGLTERARNFLDKNCRMVPSKKCPNCGFAFDMARESEIYKDESKLGMFDDGPKLKKYHLNNGKIAKEVVQAVQWSSGPCIFLCLHFNGKNKFTWSKKDIEGC